MVSAPGVGLSAVLKGKSMRTGVQQAISMTTPSPAVIHPRSRHHMMMSTTVRITMYGSPSTMAEGRANTWGEIYPPKAQQAVSR